MVSQQEYSDQSYPDHHYDDKKEELEHKKNVKRMLDEHLERKRLKEEFKDEFDEYGEDFDWDNISK